MAGLGLHRWRRAKLRKRPLPAEWIAIIERNVPYVRLLSPQERRQHAGDVQVFLAEKRFEGCAGLRITDEIRLTIAAQACLLLLNRDTDYYPTLRSVLVYPAGYVADTTSRQPDGTVIEGPQHRSGESWLRGAVVLSWDDARRGAADPFDGHNVVLHEFAHQLDGESGANEGAPALADPSHYAAWARVMGGEYRQLIADLERRMPTLIDAYGATAPAEFFAVVTESFFERPLAMRGRHPELYEQLRSFYRQDPAARLELAGAGAGAGAGAVTGHRPPP